MSFVTLEDETGVAETIWFPATYQHFGALMEQGTPIWVRGRVQVEFNVATLSVEAVWSPPS
jgi:error-prone DNA polymerase